MGKGAATAGLGLVKLSSVGGSGAAVVPHDMLLDASTLALQTPKLSGIVGSIGTLVPTAKTTAASLVPAMAGGIGFVGTLGCLHSFGAWRLPKWLLDEEEEEEAPQGFNSASSSKAETGWREQHLLWPILLYPAKHRFALLCGCYDICVHLLVLRRASGRPSEDLCCRLRAAFLSDDLVHRQHRALLERLRRGGPARTWRNLRGDRGLGPRLRVVGLGHAPVEYHADSAADRPLSVLEQLHPVQRHLVLPHLRHRCAVGVHSADPDGHSAEMSPFVLLSRE
ncbi:unnamed protein product [Symbiodinium sp. CCMP2592]|nr:unnamed protein product [Symbiodinium sp. CCMP2592]